MSGLIASRTPGADQAFVTLIANDAYVPGGVALARSLAHVRAGGEFVILYGANVSSDALGALEATGARLVRGERITLSAAFAERHERGRLHAVAPFTKGGKPAFHSPLDNFTKLRLWQLTEYRSCVFIDADAIVVQNIDALLEYPEFCGAPNVYESLSDFHRLNSGVFTARPSEKTFADMVQRLDAPAAFWRRTDQTFLQRYFPNWHGLPIFATCCNMCGLTCRSCGIGRPCGSSTTSMRNPGKRGTRKPTCSNR